MYFTFDGQSTATTSPCYHPDTSMIDTVTSALTSTVNTHSPIITRHAITTTQDKTKTKSSASTPPRSPKKKDGKGGESSPRTKPKKGYACAYCAKAFAKPSALRSHIYTHTGEKPFGCDIPGCDRRFAVISNLRRHQNVHKREMATPRLSPQERLWKVKNLMRRVGGPPTEDPAQLDHVNEPSGTTDPVTLYPSHPYQEPVYSPGPWANYSTFEPCYPTFPVSLAYPDTCRWPYAYQHGTANMKYHTTYLSNNTRKQYTCGDAFDMIHYAPQQWRPEAPTTTTTL